jgi:hypothetical protein
MEVEDQCPRCFHTPEFRFEEEYLEINGHCKNCNDELGARDIVAPKKDCTETKKCDECNRRCEEDEFICKRCSDIRSDCCGAITRILPDGTRCCFRCAKCSKCGGSWSIKGNSTWKYRQLPICSKCAE